MKLLFVFGTRPETIKLAPVFLELAGRPNFDCKICVTGQHREMLTQVLEMFELRPDWNLDLMRPNQDLAYLTGAVLSGVGEVLDAFRPDRVIVQGDTTTTFAGALAAFYHRIPVAHVEAGLRTDDIYSPWPEEVNRRLVTHIADLHFAPTARARENLQREGVGGDRIFVTGNTGIDALLRIAALLDNRSDLLSRCAAVLPSHFAGRRMILMTGHRRESFDGGIARPRLPRDGAHRRKRRYRGCLSGTSKSQRAPGDRAASPASERAPHRAGRLSRVGVSAEALPFCGHRFRGDSGGGTILWETGAGYPRHNRTPGGYGTGACCVGGYRRGSAFF